MTTEVFEERQHFKQIWLWALLIVINGLFIYGLVSQVFSGQTFGDNSMANGQLIFATAGVFLLTLLFVFLRLDTTIQADGIYYRYLPFQWTYKKIAWERISKVYVRQYNPLTEYGGWGLRIGLFGSGRHLMFRVTKDFNLFMTTENFF